MYPKHPVTMASIAQQEERLGGINRKIATITHELIHASIPNYLSVEFKNDIESFKDMDSGLLQTKVEDTREQLNISVELLNAEEKRRKYEDEMNRVLAQKKKKEDRKAQSKRLHSQLRTGLVSVFFWNER